MRQTRVWILGALCVALLAAPQVSRAVCVGDCNTDDTVAINELIGGVNIALGTAAVATCPSFDANSDGMVSINELISGVNGALNGCQPTTTGFCGDRLINVEGETCDDGNNQGGDDCAANCTTEVRRATVLDPVRAKATAQLATLAIPLKLVGTQALITGGARDTEVRGKDGQLLFRIGEVPIVVKAADVKFEPIPVFGTVCACVRGFAVDAFGPGISGTGVAGCGPQGLTDVDFRVEQDHNVTPGDINNSGPPPAGLVDDPGCDDVIDAGHSVTSTACLEGTGAACSTPNNEHIGPPPICNSARPFTFTGGQAPRGSVLLYNSSAIGLLMDGATCAETRKPNGDCKFADYGPDCKPCTEDDLKKGTPNVSPTTSGTAEIILYDANNTKGLTLKDGNTCGAATTPCVAKVSGSLADCDALAADPTAPLRGTLVTAFPTLDAETTGDSIVTTSLAAEQ